MSHNEDDIFVNSRDDNFDRFVGVEPRGKERTFALKVHLSTKVPASGQKYEEVVRSLLKFAEVVKSRETFNEVLGSIKYEQAS